VGWGRDTNDVFKKRLTRGRTYRVEVDGPKRRTGGRSLDLLVYRPGAKEIWQPSHSFCVQSCVSGSNDARMTFTANRTGTYFFHVYSFLSDTYGYRLTVQRV
jgi:hypothetical protein